jgi:hypothetical protein
MDNEAKLNVINESGKPSDELSDSFKLEIKDAQLQQLGLQNEKLRAQVAGIQNANDQRLPVQNKLWNLIIAWLGCVLVIVILSGTDNGIAVPLCCKPDDGLPCFHLHLKYDSSVLIALITTPTVSIIGLVAILLRYLFPSRDEK